jgi:hypothetical protein
MIKKGTFSLILAFSLAIMTSLYGCNAKKTIEDASDNIKQGSENTVKNSVDLVEKIKDTSMEYGKEDFKKDLDKKGVKTETSDTTKPYFSVKSEDYKIVGGSLSVYEYDVNGKDKLLKDIGTIAENGTVINGTKISWSKAPHIYKKGRVVVIFDGDDEVTLTSLKDILGEPLIG